ncbi:hypothetical protein NL676_003873 [Syzygium grande]|nr:hypothetical protein NL676_003873 [Syzygium grande]
MSSNKKQAIEAAINRPNVLLRNVYPLDKANVSFGTDSNCPSIPGQVQGGLVARTLPFLYKANVSPGTDGMGAGRRDFKDSCQGEALANSHNPDEMLKAKINDVHDSENAVHVPIRNSFKKVSDGRLLRTTNGEAITHNQNSAQFSGTTSQVGTVEANAHLASESNSNLRGNAKKQKACTREKLATAREPGPNIYPLSNQSLLSTGVFDGAPVKYTLWSGDYISPCQFERHAGGKSKKPYSCIYLDNGKSINQVCRELRATPKDMLFHRLPKIAGSAFTWLSFNNYEGQVNPECRKAK